MLYLSSKQLSRHATVCHVFEKDWIECASGIGQIRAHKECALEFEDLHECVTREKTLRRLMTIANQKKKLMKEGKYTPPDYHRGKEEPRP
uniref:NADH dehydrogenase [ubiquinone] iron-sulfur protein 5 n=1 Tax=Pelusios castaneus TaxID=367368 RepID=A0A8C8S3V1_9SAUR